MGWKGHRRITDPGSPAARAEIARFITHFQEIPDSKVVAWADLEVEINRKLGQHRGGLPGGAVLALIGELFGNQSAPWDAIARKHLLFVWKCARQFVQVLFAYLTDERTSKMLMEVVLDPALAKIKGRLMRKAEELNWYRL